MADGYRITEGGVDSRIDEALNTRVTEGFTASGNGITFVGHGSITAFPKATIYNNASLIGDGSVVARNRFTFHPGVILSGGSSLTAVPTKVLFSSSVFVNVSGVWKAASIFTNSDGIWASPVKQSFKVNENWKRVY